jgi:hypothetical protein
VVERGVAGQDDLPGAQILFRVLRRPTERQSESDLVAAATTLKDLMPIFWRIREVWRTFPDLPELFWTFPN